MGYQRYPPPERLKDIVQFFWEFEDDFTEANAYQQAVTASVCPKLAFQYRGQMGLRESNGYSATLFRSGFQAQSATYGQIFSEQAVSIFGVYFFPQAIPILFNIPAVAITNLNIEISALLNKEGTILEEQIMLCRSTAERLHVISTYLISKLKAPSPEEQLMTNIISRMLNNNGSVNIKALAADMGFSKKQVERKFHKFTGFAPKQFSRIISFENSIVSAYQYDRTLTTLAYELGYYDQSHFNRSFREFSGQNPREFFSHDLSILLATWKSGF